MFSLNYPSIIVVLFTALFFNNLKAQSICVELPEMNGIPSSFVSPNYWSIWKSSPDIIVGNGSYPGTALANITNVNGSSLAGGEMVFLLINGVLGTETEAITTELTGLTPGTTYFFDVEWQQVVLDYISFSNDPSGGKLGVYLDGLNVGVFTSLGGYADYWQKAAVTFTATSSQHTIGLKGELLDNANMGAIVLDNFPCIAYLGVDLVNFEAEIVEDNVLLSWNTISEVDNDWFGIEKSSDLVNWNLEAVIDGADNSINTLFYSYLDKKPLVDNTYYRLRMTDFNGEYSYSEIRSVNRLNFNDSELHIFPNPASGKVTLEGLGVEQMMIMDLSGQVIKNDFKVLSTSNNCIKLDVSSLSPGTYIVQSPFTTELLIKH